MKITITGLPGSGTSSVGRRLADRLDYQFESGGNMFRNRADELQMSLYDFDEFVRTHPEHDLWLDNKQKEYGLTHDDFVLESRLGWFCVPDSVKVRLDCDFEERMRRIAFREQIPVEEAKEKNQAREKTYVRYRELYGIADFLADEHFDLVVDNTSCTEQEATDQIMQLIESRIGNSVGSVTDG